jgi:uncharacterized membrane protein
MWSELKIRETQRVLPFVIDEAPSITGDVLKGDTPKKNGINRAILGAMLLLILFYLDTSALRFLNVTEETYGIFWPRRGWLYVHVVAGISAILLGPVQFWPGLKQKYGELHRVIGVVYVASAEIGGVAAIYLAFHTDFGWMFSLGLGSMAVAWMISTSLATIAICRGMIDQHREWMIRSYVLTFGFVVLRITTGLLDVANIGSIPDRFAFSSWISWAVPLMITETVLQGRKVFGGISEGLKARTQAGLSK